jgi:hypothetical protein
LPKVLKAYLGEEPTDPIRSIPENLLRVVVVLFWQHNDQLKSGLPWMKVHINHWLLTKGRVLNACVRGFGDQAMSLEVRGMRANHGMCMGCTD